MQRHFVFSIIFMFFLSSCFGGLEKRGSVTGYYNGVVRTKGGQFKLGLLPNHWKKKKIKFHALLFENQLDHSTITVDSFCRSAVDGGSLEKQMELMLRGIRQVKVIERKLQVLSGRDALHTLVTGKIDGRSIFADFYVLKMNECVFDFFYITYPGETQHHNDFKTMVQGFQYIDGPEPI